MRSPPPPLKLNNPTPVPTKLPKINTIRRVPPWWYVGAHATIVGDVQDALLHSTDGSSDELGLRSIELKFSPEIDTEAPPVGAMFDGPLLLTAGASKVKSTDDVPTAPLTVTTGRAFAPDPPAKPQARVVCDTHDVVVQAPYVCTDTVGVESAPPESKARPAIVTPLSVPLLGAL